MDFAGKIAVVTGGAAGIGKATAREFAERHAAVAIVDRDARTGRQTADELRKNWPDVEFFEADVSAGAQVEGLIPGIVQRFGGIDILVSNAGIQRYGSVLSTPEEVWDEVMAVNLKAAFLLSKHAIPEMIKRGGGSIVMVGSVQSCAAVVNSVAYVASKHGLLGLARAMALDHAKHNIRVNCVCPGAIDTPMLHWSASLSDDPERVLEACRSLHTIHRLGQPEEIAHVIVFLASDLASFITGQGLLVDAGMLAAVGGMAFQQSGTGAGKE